MTRPKTPFYCLPGLPTNGFPSRTRHDARARRAVLSAQRGRRSDCLVVDYSGEDVHLALQSAGELLVCGPWGLEVYSSGGVAEPLSAWGTTCWFSDQNADYLELEIRLRQGLRVERAIMLAKRDRVVYLADAVLGRRRGAIDYRADWPLAPGVRGRAARRTRECALSVGRAQALVLPLALGEWRADGQPAGLSLQGRSLRLNGRSEGHRLLAPLWLDLQGRPARGATTWRRLTVAQDRAAVADHLAVGFRVQASARQWLVYRSLGPRANRTLLGHNLSTEMLVGRFTKAGLVEPLVEIE